MSVPPTPVQDDAPGRAALTPLEYAATPVDDRGPPPKLSTLAWLSLPAVVGAAVMAASAYALANRSLPAGEMKNLLAALVAVAVVSGIPSGAVTLGVLESRKTVMNVTLMTFNAAWLAACVAWLLLV